MSWFADLYGKAQDQYGVNPLIFIALYLFSFVPFYWGVFYILKGLKRHHVETVVKGVAVNRLAWGLPYLYVLFLGHDLPRIIIVGLVVWAIVGIGWPVLNRNNPGYVEKWQVRVDKQVDRIPKKWRAIDVVRPDTVITDTDREE